MPDRTHRERKLVSRPRSDGKRENILRAAIAVIAAEGVHGATTRKIAAEAGINLGTLHYHFESKEDVLASVISYLGALYAGNLENAFPRPEPLRERIGNLMAFIWGEVQQYPQEQIALFDLLLYDITARRNRGEPPGEDPLPALYRKALAESSDVQDGTVAPDLDRLAAFLMNGFAGLLLTWLAERDDARAEDDLAMLVLAARTVFL
jgi:AcrR family transcriptional regulator